MSRSCSQSWSGCSLPLTLTPRPARASAVALGQVPSPRPLGGAELRRQRSPPRRLRGQAVVSSSTSVVRVTGLLHVACACRRVSGVRPLPAGASLGRSGCVATRADIVTCGLVRPYPHHSSRDRVRGASPASWGPSSALQRAYPALKRRGEICRSLRCLRDLEQPFHLQRFTHHPACDAGTPPRAAPTTPSLSRHPPLKRRGGS
jgi:hypothetical protein